MRIRKTSGTGVAVLLAIPVFLSILSAGMADEPLRWKFQKGQKTTRNIVHQMALNVEGAASGDSKFTCEMNWEVQDVNPQGDAIVLLTFGHIHAKITNPYLAAEYDSQAENPASAGTIAPIYKAIASGKYLLTISPRGQVKDVQIPAEVLAALTDGAQPGKNDATGKQSATDALKTLLKRGIIELPEEPIAPGREWTIRTTEPNPPMGEVTVDTVYKYQGTKKIDNKMLASIQATQKLEFTKNQFVQVTMKEQNTKGEVLFDQDAGRLNSMSIAQTAKLDLTVGGQTTPGAIEQKIEVNVKPPGTDTNKK